jgi:hypothetical protein
VHQSFRSCAYARLAAAGRVIAAGGDRLAGRFGLGASLLAGDERRLVGW